MACSANGVPGNLNKIVQGLEDSLRHACEQLTGDELPNTGTSEFNRDEFWQNFVSATKLLSHEATKLCMAFDSKCEISSQECQCLIDRVEKSCLTLLAVFLKLSKLQGMTLHRKIRLYVLDILNGMVCLCNAIKSQRSGLQKVGDVWAHCEAVESLPKDNKDAVLQLCEQQLEMVQDAIQELMTAIDDENEAPLVTPVNGLQLPSLQTWSSSDRNILLPCSGLLKAAKACIKKTIGAISARGNGNHEESIHELDLIADIIKSSSCIADDFVLSLYPPINHSIAREQALCVRNHSEKLLSTVKNVHFYSPTDEVWIEFLEKAVNHNWVRINDMALVE